MKIHEPPHDKTNKMTVHPTKTQISLGIRPVWSESSLCAQWVAKDPSFLHADSGQTGWMPRPIRVFTEHTVTLLVLSCRGSHVCYLSPLAFTLKKSRTVVGVFKFKTIQLYVLMPDGLELYTEQKNDKTNWMSGVPSKDWDQAAHPGSLISLQCLHEVSYTKSVK